MNIISEIASVRMQSLKLGITPYVVRMDELHCRVLALWWVMEGPHKVSPSASPERIKHETEECLRQIMAGQVKVFGMKLKYDATAETITTEPTEVT